MKNVFIAIGGSGTKVAEAMVKLLGLGFPIRFDQNSRQLTSYGSDIHIWRIDPDKSAGAADQLKRTLNDYEQLQTLTGTYWSEIKTDITNTELDPLNLNNSGNSSPVKNLRTLVAMQETALPFLHPFYEEKDLDVDISEGFYQKPFIGSAVMALFAETLDLTTTEQGRTAGLMAYDNEETNFFLCGSLHGGTGASGVPIMAKFLKNRRRKQNITSWNIGGCLLGPYFLPPAPPFKADEGDLITPSNLSKKIDEYLKKFGEKDEFMALDDEAKRKLFKLILQGYYAKPEEVIRRARQGLEYYRSNSDAYFDLLYLVSKPSPNILPSNRWSNGGLSQRNPLNSAEIAAALAALEFFSQTSERNLKDQYKVPGGPVELDSSALRLGNLPCYRVGNELIVPEKAFFVSGLLCYLIEQVLPWSAAYAARGRFKFFETLHERGLNLDSEGRNYTQIIHTIGDFLKDLTQQHNVEYPTGWSRDNAELDNFFDKRFTKTIWRGLREIYPVRLGGWEINEKIFEDFENWVPDGNFTRGEYLRFIWSKLYENCEVVRGKN
ncbi:MAG: hypothetical protein LUM44_06310 [Pyrinomonadaceae bacterium]|nr:hypothetical protein [Pyrinomonadaceae bacterium]